MPALDAPRHRRKPAPIATPTGGVRHDGRIGATLRIPPRLHREAKRLCIELTERRGRPVSLQELFVEGLLMVFAKAGQPVPKADE